MTTTIDPSAITSAQLYPGPFYEYRHFMERRYGKALHKVPVDFNYGCPHRTAEHHGGCTFCPEDGSRASQIDGIDSLSGQIDAAVKFAQHRYGAVGFTAYVQAYTATFAPVSKFKEHMADILSRFPFDALHLGTRPDCLPASTLDYLKILSKQIDLWVELGLQTVHDKTLLRIQREHDWACSIKGIEKLKAKGLQVVSHIILGLPGETREDMIETARVMAQLPLDGIKIHNLHVLEKTQLAVEYKEQPFPLLGELEYLHLVAEFLRHLPPDLPIMRINTDTPPKELVAPHWDIQKGQLRERLCQHMEMMGYRQGDCFPGFGEHIQSEVPINNMALNNMKTANAKELSKFKTAITMDGSTTIMSSRTGEPYHPRKGALWSSQERFINLAKIKDRLQQGNVKILDIGFGAGYNSFLALNEAEECSQSQENPLANNKLVVWAFEQDRMSSLNFQGHHRAFSCIDGNLLLNELNGTNQLELPHHHTLKLYWGDARYHLQGLDPNSVDLIFLDPFDEKNNTELVSIELIQWLSHLLREGGEMLTSRTHPAVRRAFLESGLELISRPTGLQAIKNKSDQSKELDSIRLDSRSLPYRDPNLCWSHKDIVRHRNKALSKT